jgi:hypothetical protein
MYLNILLSVSHKEADKRNLLARRETKLLWSSQEYDLVHLSRKSDLFRRFRIIVKSDYYLGHVRPSPVPRTEQHGSHQTDFHET